MKREEFDALTKLLDVQKDVIDALRSVCETQSTIVSAIWPEVNTYRVTMDDGGGFEPPTFQ